MPFLLLLVVQLSLEHDVLHVVDSALWIHIPMPATFEHLFSEVRKYLLIVFVFAYDKDFLILVQFVLLPILPPISCVFHLFLRCMNVYKTKRQFCSALLIFAHERSVWD